jgi:hypothetical protein
MLGAFAVGKTSLVQRFVHSIFSEKYTTTLGVKIDKKSVEFEGQQVELILWDLAGEDEFLKVRTSYLRGSSGYLLVADGTRAETLDIAEQLSERVRGEIGELPFLLLINKCDLAGDWQIQPAQIERLKALGWEIIETSAMSNEHVDDAFLSLTRKMEVV